MLRILSTHRSDEVSKKLRPIACFLWIFLSTCASCGAADKTDRPLTKARLDAVAQSRDPLTEQEIVQVLEASVFAARKKPFALRRDATSTMSETERLHLIERLLKESRKIEAARQIDSLPSVDDDPKEVAARAKLLVRADRFEEAAELILAFVGTAAPSDPALISTLAAAECGLKRPEFAAIVRHIEYRDEDAKAECRAALLQIGVTDPE